MNPYIGVMGGYLIVDGVGSIIIYRKQTLKEHIPRVLRTIVGIALLAFFTF